jgi:hypothetical protein
VMFLINLACLGLSFGIPNRGSRMTKAAKV